MSAHNNNQVKRKTIRDIAGQKGGAPIVCLTAYSAPMAAMADQSADLILVGDSLGMVLYGMDSTVGVSVDMMVNHGRAVMRGAKKALVVVDMPFGSYQESEQQAFRNAARIMKETEASAVKLEGGTEMAGTVSFLTQRGVAVMGHIGLQPQSVHATGGYKVVGREAEEFRKVIDDAKALEKAGAFSVVLECIDPDLALEVTRSVSVPTIGIGASSVCDGQILVTEDMLGLSGHDETHKVPKFVKPYASLGKEITSAMAQYAREVRERSFPAEEHIYKSSQNKKKLKVLK